MEFTWWMIAFCIGCLCIYLFQTRKNHYSNGCYHEWQHSSSINGTMHEWKCKKCPATKTTGAGVP